MIVAWRRAADGVQLFGSALVPLLCFGLGVGFSVTVRHRLYANAMLVTLALAWAVLAKQARRAPPATMPDSPRKTPSLDEHAERLRLRTMLDQTPAPLVLADPDGALRAVNRAARTLFGADDLILPRPPALMAAMASALPGSRAVLRLPGASGGERSYALQVATLGGASGILRLGVLIDIQAELQAAEAAALRQLLQVLGHELMNSLTPVASLAESARDVLAEDGQGGIAQATDALEVILRRTRALDGFVRGYRALARLPPPVVRPVSVTGLLEDAAALFRTRWEKLGVTLAVNAPVPDIVVDCDAGQMSQALLNLLANAAEATLNGENTSRSVALAVSSREGKVTILVSDNGLGIQSGHEDAIYRPFFTTKSGGDGIGLALARQIALAHGGALELRAASTLGGATFALSLS